MESGGHLVTEHAAGQRRLAPRDTSRYGTLRLTITRNRNGTGTVSVVVRDVRGGMLRDTRLAVTSIDLSPGTPASELPEAALGAALAAAFPGPPS